MRSVAEVGAVIAVVRVTDLLLASLSVVILVVSLFCSLASCTHSKERRELSILNVGILTMKLCIHMTTFLARPQSLTEAEAEKGRF